MAKENKGNAFTNAFKKNSDSNNNQNKNKSFDEKNKDNHSYEEMKFENKQNVNNHLNEKNIKDDSIKQTILDDLDEDDSKKVKKLKEKVKELEKRNEELNLLLVQSDEKNKELEIKIKNYESSFTNAVKAKELQAQKLVNMKIDEYRQKYENELKNYKKYALKDKATDLIDVINQFDAVVNMPNNNPEVQNYIVGFKMFSTKFKNYLEDNNIFEIPIKENDEFNPEVMEAIDVVKNKDFKPHKVIKIITKGYKIHDLLLVPAKVIISK